jgi:hypothetical protein
VLKKVLFAAALAVVPTVATAVIPTFARAESVDAQSVVYGPYATIRRANEVIDYARSQGYRAQLLSGCAGGYYVRVL